MDFSLTKNAKILLSEIILYRNEKGICDSKHWQKRFSELSNSEDSILRSAFNELQQSNMINVMWADNYPYFMTVLSNGISYYEKMKEDTKTNSSLKCLVLRLLIEGKYIQTEKPIIEKELKNNRKYKKWLNDIKIMADGLPKKTPFKKGI